MSSALPKVMACAPAQEPLRIGVVYSRLPFPMMRGDQTTVAHLISFLTARGHELDLYALSSGGALTPEQDEWLRSSCRKVHLYDHGPVRKILGLVAGLSRLRPMQVSIFTNRQLRRDLERVARDGDLDILYCYYPRTSLDMPTTSTAGRPASYLALQLSQTLNTRRMAQHERNLLKRAVFSIEARLMARFEARIWRRFRRVVLIGPEDVRAVRAQCAAYGQPEIDNWIYGPHGTDTERFNAADPTEIVPDRVVFSGSMSYPPNVQAVEWFVAHVWPLVRLEVPEASLMIQGRDPARSVQRMHGRDGIVVTGTVPDVGEIIRSAQVCVNPMLAAGGMQNKLIEYMASGKAIVASSVANEGIMAPDDVLVIADTADEFARAVLDLLSDSRRALALGTRAREYALSDWTWEKHFLDLEAAFVADARAAS